MVWDSPLTALAASSGFREQEHVSGALVLCPGHSKQNRVAGARLGNMEGVGVGSSRQGCGRPHGRTPSPEKPDEREGGAPAPHLPLSVLTPLPLWRPRAPSVQICGPEWGQQRVSAARLQTRVRDQAGPSGGGGKRPGAGPAPAGAGPAHQGTGQRPRPGNFRGRWGRRGQKPACSPQHTSPVPVSSLTLPEIPSITHRRAKSGVLSSSLRSCLRR